MTASTMPTDPRELPCGPDSVEIAALHLSVTQRWESGSSQNVHLVENSDLGVILKRGQEQHSLAHKVPHDSYDTGLVVISLGVDEDHDEVHFQHCSKVDLEELLGQAIEALVACRDAASRVRKAGD